MKTTNETELKQLKKKAEILVGFYEQREVATKEKLEMTHYQLVAEKNQWWASEENLKVAIEEIHKHKQQTEQIQEHLQETGLTFRYQTYIHEKNVQDNWIKA